MVASSLKIETSFKKTSAVKHVFMLINTEILTKDRWIKTIENESEV